MRRRIGIAAMIAGLPLIMVAAAAALFVWVSKRSPDISSYDAVVVFAGGDNRIEFASERLRAGAAPHLIVSPADARSLRRYEQ